MPLGAVIPAKAGIQAGQWLKSDKIKDGFRIKSGMTITKGIWL